MLFQKIILFLLIVSTGARTVIGQCTSGIDINNLIIQLDQDRQIKLADKLNELKSLKIQFEKCKHRPDSVYAKLLNKISIIEFEVNGFRVNATSIPYALEAIAINTSGKKDADSSVAIKSYFNVSIFYHNVGLNKLAFKYYDTAILFAQRYPVYQAVILTARFERAGILSQQGDYQESIHESSIGLRAAQELQQPESVVRFLNQRAQSNLFQKHYDLAFADARLASEHLEAIRKAPAVQLDTEKLKKLYFQLANSYKIMALSKTGYTELPEVQSLMNTAISYRLKSGDRGMVADDYNDYGAYFFSEHKDFNKATANYQKSLVYADDLKIRYATAHLNIGAAQFVQGKYLDAEKNYLLALKDLSLQASSILQNPTLQEITLINQTEFIHVYLNNKTEYLLSRYRQTQNPALLKACLETALLTDSVIKFIRREQGGELSKLFWRSRTREFFTNALEACFLARNSGLAFHFMESSRAVILADKMNELGASSLLPLAETLEEQRLRKLVISEQEKVTSMQPGTEQYRLAYDRLLQQKEKLDRFLQVLEKKYPAYYQYKYSADVPTLDDLKKFLSANKQSFVHYFVGDTVSFALGITADRVEMLVIPNDQFQKAEITNFLSTLANKQMLNAGYQRFTELSHRLYKTLFEPLKLPRGRTVICPDNFLLPFDALSTDPSGKKMLIEDYAVSYIYSAGYLLKQFPEYPAKGNFLGFAPVSFQSHLRVADLTNSAPSLDNVASNYTNAKLYTAKEATKKNFLSNVGHYNIVNIFSHARADNTDTQPILYMQDSIISLSELQYVNRPGTKLVVLSACQTTVGKNATGEGIYSLARGFASAGIPSVAATMWKADEETVYAISKLFHQYLSRGTPMDEALQKAKLQFMQNADREHLLPYYWANMVLIGKVEPLKLEKTHKYRIWYISGISLLLLTCIAVLLRKRRRNVT